MAVYSYPIVTGLTAAALGILCIILTIYVIAGRATLKVGLGDGGHDAMNNRIRMHGNFIENAPIFLILLGLVELSGRHPLTVGCLGPAFVACRISHAIGLRPSMGAGRNPFRFVGTLGTMICLSILSVELLLMLLPHLGEW
jgi:uncharacterized membrane protein YecN with MAPEG domain